MTHRVPRLPGEVSGRVGPFDRFAGATTIITFLLVALLRNTQTRSDHAVQHKLNALAQALGDLMEHLDQTSQSSRDLERDRRELRAAVGLEEIESSDEGD